MILNVLTWIMSNRKSLFKAIAGLAIGGLLAWGVTLSNQNKKLSESLEMAQNNIEAHQGIVDDSQQANNVLRLDVETLQNQSDKQLRELDSIRQELKIKPKEVNAAATQTQTLHVNGGKGVGGELKEILKDTTYTDSLKYNDLTTVYYTISNDSVAIVLDVENTQFLYIYSKKEYKNKKNFFKRLFTLDFKKVTKYKYSIVNTNDLLNTSDVRIVEINKK